MFLDFMSLLYGSFEALFLAVQACLMSAMITPVFLVPDNDVVRVPFLVTFTMANCALVLVFLVLVCVMWCKHHLFLGELVNPVHGDEGEWVRLQGSGLRCIQVVFLYLLIGLWTAAIASEILSFSS